MSSGGTPQGEKVHSLVDHLFRRESGRLVALLVRSFGSSHLDLAEEVVQEALVQALRRWPFLGVPRDPAAWLYRVARNRALDRLRRDASFRGKEEAIRHSLPRDSPPAPVHLDGELTDDQLRLVFLCCHPQLPRDASVALTLKTVCGLGVREIARGFLAKEATIAQRLVRAQRRIQELALPYEVPPPDELGSRLELVLEVIYLLFNEGHVAHDGELLVRPKLCAEALHLAAGLARHPRLDRPEVHALAALLCFQSSRLPARLDERGGLVLLPEQDRSRWDRSLIARGFAHLERSSQGPRLTSYHLQAVIASEHARADRAEATDWAAIARFYGQLMELDPSPVAALNQAVAISKVEGPRAALARLESLAPHRAVADYHLYHATRAELLRELGRLPEATAALRSALQCTATQPERQLLEQRLEELTEDQNKARTRRTTSSTVKP